MNKLTRKQYIKLVCETLLDTYGESLAEFDTDIEMAEAVVKKMKKYLYFSSETAKTQREYQEWKKRRVNCMELDLDEE